jgi:DNA polymerase III delta prime subunit
MFSGIQGQTQAITILQKLLDENVRGRTIILLGNAGIGKFTAAVKFASALLQGNPFLSPDFLFYRNDDFLLKTRFLLENIRQEGIKKLVPDYLFYLLGRISSAYSLGEIGKTLKLKKLTKGGESPNIQDFQIELEEILLNGKTFDFLENNPAFRDNLVQVSEALSTKQRVPIDFIRSLIQFHSRKPAGKVKVSIIGNIENATEEAQNSSLKLFEEPTYNSLIILTASQTKTILPTILSRSIIIRMNQLTPGILKNIFQYSVTEKYNNTLDWMENSVYEYSKRAAEKVSYFFKQIAPKVQKDNQIFSFIEDICKSENSRLSIYFLQELLDFLRNVHLARQSYLRNTDFNIYLKQEYQEIIFHLIRQTNTAELREFSMEISDSLRGVLYGNLTDSLIFPAILINLSRWYQRRYQ